MTDQTTLSSPIDQARAAIERAKTLGYSHALLCLTPIDKEHIIEHDLLADLRQEGFTIHPGTTPDYPKLEAGDDHHEIIKIVWERNPLPAWATSEKAGVNKKSAAKKKAAAKAPKAAKEKKAAPKKAPAKKAAAKKAPKKTTKKKSEDVIDQAA